MTDSNGCGKPCPHCKTPMANIASLNLRVCIGCQHEEPWTLNEKQKPLVNSSRGDRKQ